MTDRIEEENLAEYIGRRILDDAEKLRLFMPDCFARFPLDWRDCSFEIRIILKGDSGDEPV